MLHLATFLMVLEDLVSYIVYATPFFVEVNVS